jgi:hypothetical protein
MLADDGIHVAPSKLVGHATGIDGVADDIATARQAGNEVRLDAQAYGKLCTIVPVLLDGLQGLMLDGMDAAIGSLHDTGGRLRTAAQAYQSTDQQRKAVHDQLRNEL